MERQKNKEGRQEGQEQAWKLTPRQERFVAEYVLRPVGTCAAIKAGYSRVGASTQQARLLRIPAVRSAIDIARARRDEYIELTTTEVVRSIREGIADAVAAGDHRAAMRGREMLAKHMGMLVDRQQLETKLSFAELVRLADQDKSE